MSLEALETVQIGDKYYVTIKTAIKYLHTSYERMMDLISLEVIPVKYIESRRLIELEFLEGFATLPRTRGRVG